MEIFHMKPLNYSLTIVIIIFFVSFPCFLCSLQFNATVTTSASLPLLPPLPLIPSLLNFLDQRLAEIYPIIQTFKNSITADPLNITGTWVGSDICNYKGFFCSNPPDNESATTISSIDFNGFQLAAPSLDGFIDQLPDVALFHANSNKFSGTITDNLAKLPYLYELDISNNDISGSFPIPILDMKDLSFLDLRFNSFSGLIPPEIFMKDLQVIFLNNNNFMQPIPENIGSTPALYITLASNKLTGPIPRSIGNASSTLKEILLFNNLLVGCIPYEVGFLKNAIVFDASNNQLTGPLPCSLGCLKKMEQLNLANNQLYGEVPEVLCALKNLENLSLSNNYFTKVGPTCENLIQGGVLDLRGNCISGFADQRTEEECSTFFSQPITCPYSSSLKLIPCSTSGSARSPSTNSVKASGVTKTSWVTYQATDLRHRL
ncbi:hypothetical protein LWI29_012703 [Acer saccharum]|uniref:Leucine-rich repeat-containing N-terminal plant-type domain-containing protein n=1 Tax=Acer saccharum TaxID=4024 RepID=A0AA39RW94_ACESA|nr:hypothetical protein LWI29_012703 [Acer saccharum]KAK1558628.1 hypothetical protein Q3G72_004753 [Acer saccharum]